MLASDHWSNQHNSGSSTPLQDVGHPTAQPTFSIRCGVGHEMVLFLDELSLIIRRVKSRAPRWTSKHAPSQEGVLSVVPNLKQQPI